MAISTVKGIIAVLSPTTPQDARLDDFISLATLETGTVYGDNTNKAIAYLVLHWLEMENRGGAGGPIRSEKEGDLARSYAVPKDLTDLDSTSWGQRLKALRRSFILGPRNRTIP